MLRTERDPLFATYERFTNLLDSARVAISEALEADEGRKSGKLVTRQSITSKYRVAIRKINDGLNLSRSKFPPSKQADVEKYCGHLRKHLEMILGRIKDLESEASTSTIPVTSTRRLLSTERLLRNVDRKLGEEIVATIIERTGVKLTDVEGNAAAKRALEESVILPTLNPALFTGLRAPCKGILLYGPPGNGKTMIAKAVADEAQCTFFNISASTIMSKWVGEGEKLVKTLFQVAKNAEPAIVFIDEVDSMLCERSENENGAARRVKTEFLLQLDGCTSTPNDRILVLAATNRPQELDDGILRRFPQKIFVDLPDAATRAVLILRVFERHQTKVSLTKKELDIIATQTENYSFSDIFALCRAAAMIPLQNVSRDRLKNISEQQLRAVNYADMVAALELVRPTTSADKRQKLREFAVGSRCAQV